MSAASQMRTRRAADRAARSGSGPLPASAPIARFPGATAKFALLGEVLLAGVVVAALSIPLVTLPAALAAGTAHVRRFIAAEGSTMRQLLADFRAALRGGVGIGAAALAVAAVLALDIVVAPSVPGGAVVAVAGWVLLVALGTIIALAAASFSPEGGWIGTLRRVPRAVAADPGGAAYTAVAVAFTGFITTVLVPLLLPAMGCLVLALVAIPERPRRTGTRRD
ncbi:hypothetical protein [Microbacterium gorillae]|uniref:hypothetical protein n=1 Tax=Microbacterium gorillae TaxID=1231063 RepID=UPI003D959383